MATSQPPDTAATKRAPKHTLARTAKRIMIGVGIAVGCYFLMFAYGSVKHDRLELLDQPLVSETADVACERLVADLARAGAGAVDRGQLLRSGDEAIQGLISTMRNLGEETLKGDHPATGWVDDWELVIEARHQLEDDLKSDPTATFTMPQTPDGYPISRRMKVAGSSVCETAITLAITQ